MKGSQKNVGRIILRQPRQGWAPHQGLFQKTPEIVRKVDRNSYNNEKVREVFFRCNTLFFCPPQRSSKSRFGKDAKARMTRSPPPIHTPISASGKTRSVILLRVPQITCPILGTTRASQQDLGPGSKPRRTQVPIAKRRLRTRNSRRHRKFLVPRA